MRRRQVDTVHPGLLKSPISSTWAGFSNDGHSLHHVEVEWPDICRARLDNVIVKPIRNKTARRVRSPPCCIERGTRAAGVIDYVVVPINDEEIPVRDGLKARNDLLRSINVWLSASVSPEWRLDRKHVFILTLFRRLCGSGCGGESL